MELSKVSSANKVGKLTVFNIGGNKGRLIAAIHYDRNRIYFRAVQTHTEYDAGNWKEYVMQNLDVNRTADAFSSLAGMIFVRHSEEEYGRLVAQLDGLIDEVGENESHPLASLMAVISILIEKY